VARIAINICDLDALTPRSQPGNFNPTAMLLLDYCTEHSPTVYPDKNRWDSAAVVLDGPASRDEERTTALVNLLQTVLGPRKIGRRVRCYKEGPPGGWSEIRPEKVRA